MSSELVQIEALHQSTEQVMSCPVFSTSKRSPKAGKHDRVVWRALAAFQVHHVGSEYASWCAKKSVAQDLEAFDRFALGAGPSASAKILIRHARQLSGRLQAPARHRTHDAAG